MSLTTVSVPKSLRQLAAAALEAHRAKPLRADQEVSGVAIAERLSSGEITIEDVGAMHRFFLVNARHYEARTQAAQSSLTDGICRSWSLRGGDRGRIWAARQNERFVREGLLPADPYAELLRALPEEIYDRFAVGAWRWEYGLRTPEQAAAFYESYQRATGRVLDLHAAFGPSGPAVANAVRRRVYGPDLFRDAVRRLMREQREFQDAIALHTRDDG